MPPRTTPPASPSPCEHGCDYCRVYYALSGPADSYGRHPCTLVRRAHTRAVLAQCALEAAMDTDPHFRRAVTRRAQEARDEADYAEGDAIDHYNRLLRPEQAPGKQSSWGAPIVPLSALRRRVA